MDIRWHTGLGADDALRAHLSWWSGSHVPRGRCELASLETPVEATVGRHCPACGSDTHGRPWARLPDGRRPHVSVARCGEHVVTVIADAPVGIDVESVAAVDARWDPALVLHPDEAAGTPFARAVVWCRKEAILKALGTGLRTPMSRVRCADHPVLDLPAPEGLAAAVVVIAQAGSGGSSTL